MSETNRCESCGKYVFADSVVTIPLEEYEALKARAAETRSRKSISTYRALSRSAIARSPELADFLLGTAVTKTTTEAFQLAKEKFGDACPSRSSVYRFIDTMRTHGS
ncbi:CobQ-like glutamine amidotransferase family enzyme [Pseudochelatococcus lubricantis]|uniref:CobQ-like glutamine amidotransferase family enzyme n=1 Tax=Pseudochelatococcus lubricantis TaxID=1538102 RepID=A0ABX0V4D5_9HYPH|nr:DUF4817 domain-containing protein [Pseudochelatococcus lubricantis]NIJ60077.1 CobQ-like glutamine amidotransferase family enzyme [Pseudochelatococcus lubricantis]